MQSNHWKKLITAFIAIVGIVIGWVVVEQQSASSDPTYTFETNNKF